MYKRVLTLLLIVLFILGLAIFGFLFYEYQFATEDEETVIVEEAPKPQYKNIILMIGDGMGYEHLLAADAYQESLGSNLFMLEAPQQNFVRTFPKTTAVTDSAAAATAIATGQKVDNGIISQDANGEELKTILEIAQGNDMSTGLVSTKFINDATPAAFAAHEASRKDYKAIFDDMFLVTKPDIVIGGDPEGANLADYTLDDYVQIDTVTGEAVTNLAEGQKVAGFFDFSDQAGRESLASVTEYSLDRLSSDEDGFFLMVEGAKIDTYSHQNNIANMLYEVKDFDDAVKAAYDFSSNRDDTLVIVTADHETGGLVLRDGFDELGYPNVEWEGGGHTSRYVPVLSWDEDLFSKTLMDNTEIYKIMKKIVNGASN